MKSPVYHCPRCNLKLTDESDRNENNKITHFKMSCSYCGMSLESISDVTIDPTQWYNEEHELYDVATGTIYLLSDDDDDTEVDIIPLYTAPPKKKTKQK